MMDLSAASNLAPYLTTLLLVLSSNSNFDNVTDYYHFSPLTCLPACLGFVHELRDDSGMGRLWGFMSRYQKTVSVFISHIIQISLNYNVKYDGFVHSVYMCIFNKCSVNQLDLLSRLFPHLTEVWWSVLAINFFFFYKEFAAVVLWDAYLKVSYLLIGYWLAIKVLGE